MMTRNNEEEDERDPKKNSHKHQRTQIHIQKDRNRDTIKSKEDDKKTYTLGNENKMEKTIRKIIIL